MATTQAVVGALKAAGYEAAKTAQGKRNGKYVADGFTVSLIGRVKCVGHVSVEPITNEARNAILASYAAAIAAKGIKVEHWAHKGMVVAL